MTPLQWWALMDQELNNRPQAKPKVRLRGRITPDMLIAQAAEE